MIQKCNALLDVALLFSYSNLIFTANFLEVTKEKRIFAAIVPKEECTTFLDCWILKLKYIWR